MSQRITPLTRNQLLELEVLVHNLITVVSQPLPQYQLQQSHTSSTSASLGDQSWPPDAPTTPTSLTVSVGVKPLTVFPGSGNDVRPTPVFAALSTGDVDGPSLKMNVGNGFTASAVPVSDQPVLHGTFLDVFNSPLTATSWRLYDKILYLVWWSYRPPSCTNCGMQDAWMPSGDVEYKCAFCIAGAGTTRSNDIVEDDIAVNEDVDYGGNDSGDDDDVDDKDKARGGGGGSGGAGGGPIDAYLFFYGWLQRIPLLGPGGTTGTASNNNNANCGSNNKSDLVDAGTVEAGCSPQWLSTASKVKTGAASPSNYLRVGQSGALPPASQQQLAVSTTNNNSDKNKASSSIMLPSGESLSAVLRAAYDMSSLLTTPGLPQGTASVLRAAGLYVSLLLHRYVSIFPLFCAAGRAAATTTTGAADGGKNTSRLTNTNSATAHNIDGSLADVVELQWVDVELVCALLGVTAPSFFESTEVSVQHLQNVFTVAAAYGVPSVLWHPGRVPGRVEVMKSLKDKVIPLCPLHSTTAGVSGLCPEHTAMVVALEFARRVDAHPIAASSTSPAAAAQNAQRIGLWLDALGLYPSRRVYRDVHSFHRITAQEEAVAEKNSNTVKKEECEENTKSVSGGHDTMRVWEQTLTELAAVNDPHLIIAAERHAHRHDTAALDFSGSKGGSTSLSSLTTPRSPFYKRFEWILTSPCANALLHVFAAVFQLTPMELADMALRSGIYQGHASGFVATLKTAVLHGHYDVMPLARRLSPLTSSWMAAYMALHSNDRLPLLATLSQLNNGQNTTHDRQAVLTRLVQKILRKHHAAQLYQLNFVLRVTDDDEKHFNGIYFLSNVLWQEGLAVFTCLRSGRKTITLNRFAHTLSLCYMTAKEKVVSRLKMHVVSPVVAAIETEAARLVMEVALGTVARGADTRGDPWGTVVRCLDKCARVRRRMRVPMLASRLDALASIREHASSAVARRYSQFSSLGGSGMGTWMMGPTLLGWGETEALLASAPQLDVRQLRRDLQWNYLALPNVSLLSGLSENRVVAMYASLVGLLELIHERLAAASQAAAAASSPSPTDASLNNWVEELLFVEEEEDDKEEMAAPDNFAPYDFSSPFSLPERTGLGWSPPTYRNSRGSTPKLSHSPKSKFVAVETSTNNTTSAAAPTSAFTTVGTIGGNNNNNSSSSRYAPTPPQSFTRQPYTMTPPSIVPSRSPVLSSLPSSVGTAANGGSTCTMTSSPSSTRGPQGVLKFNHSNSNNSVSAFSSLHNTVSTPIHRFQTPPSITLTTTTTSGNGPSRTPPLSSVGDDPEVKRVTGKINSNRNSNADLHGGDGGDALSVGMPQPPDLKLSASTADVEKRLSSVRQRPAPTTTQQQQQQRSPRRRAGHRRRAREDSGGEFEGDDEDERNEIDERSRRNSYNNDEAQQQKQQEMVLRLLRQILPPYWEVLLGIAQDLVLPPSTTAATSTTGGLEGRGDLVDDDEDDGETNNGVFGGVGNEDARRMAAHARERRLRKHQHQQQNSNTNGSGEGKARSTAAAATPTAAPRQQNGKVGSAVERSEVFVTRRPFNLFDAEECRRRLHRLYVFIGAYIQCKGRCVAQAAAGTLPTLPGKSALFTSPSFPASHATPVSAKPTVAPAGNLLRSPRTHLTPPRKSLLSEQPTASTSIQTAGEVGSNSYCGSGGLQRPPPRPRSSPPLAPQRQLSPHGRPQLSPPHPPEPSTNTNSNSSGKVQRATRPNSDAISPVSLSPFLISSRKNGGKDRGGGSPKQQIATTAPMRASPPSQHHGKCGSATGKSSTIIASCSGQNVRSRDGPDRTVVATLVDNENFVLPPSETSWSQLVSTSNKTSGGHYNADANESTKAPGDRPNRLPAPKVTPHDCLHSRSQRPVTAATASSSTTSSDAEVGEDSLKVAVSLQHASRKRTRSDTDSGSDADEKNNKNEINTVDRQGDPGAFHKNSDRENEHGEEDEEEEENQQQQSQLLRRKVKKSGRRRRRQEQSIQYQQRQQQTSKATSPSRNSKNSGNISPHLNSPALPRRPSNADASGKHQKTRAVATVNLGSPMQNPVPLTCDSQEAAAACSSPSASDSGRSADYDTDRN